MAKKKPVFTTDHCTPTCVWETEPRAPMLLRGNFVRLEDANTRIAPLMQALEALDQAWFNGLRSKAGNCAPRPTSNGLLGNVLAEYRELVTDD